MAAARCLLFPSAPLLLTALVSLSLLPACTNVRTLIVGSSAGAKLDPTAQRPHRPLDSKKRRVVVAIVADATGQVVDTRIVQRSGSPALDASVRAYPPAPATPVSVTTMALTYSSAEGFTEPKVLKIEPLAGASR